MGEETDPETQGLFEPVTPSGNPDRGTIHDMTEYLSYQSAFLLKAPL